MVIVSISLGSKCQWSDVDNSISESCGTAEEHGVIERGRYRESGPGFQIESSKKALRTPPEVYWNGEVAKSWFPSFIVLNKLKHLPLP